MRVDGARRTVPWERARRAALVLTVASWLLPGCGSGGSVTTPTPPPAAVIAIRIVGVSTSPSPAASSRFRTTASIELRETAGFGANINFVQLRFFQEAGDAEALEVSSLGADAIIAQTGSNRIEGRSSRELTLSFDHDSDPAASAGELVFDFTDDAANDSQRVLPVAF